MSYLNIEYCRQIKQVTKKPSEPDSVGEHDEPQRDALYHVCTQIYSQYFIERPCKEPSARRAVGTKTENYFSGRIGKIYI